jgi:hypothetical protein
LKERYCDENDPSRLMTSLRVKDWESSPTIPVTPVGGGAVSQRLIPTGERSGLQTRIATTESVSLCVRMKS